MQKGRAKEAVQSYQRVLAINAEHTEARQRMAELSRQRAEKALTEGKDEEALFAFAEALKHTPEDPALIARVDQVRVEKKARVTAALVSRSEKEAGAKNWEAAINSLEEASRLSPEDAHIQKRLSETKAAQEKSRLDGALMRAEAAARLARWNEAIDILKELSAARPDDEAVQRKLGEARKKQRESQLNALRAQARSFAKAEKFDEALTAWNEYAALESPDEKTAVEIAALKKAQSLWQSYADAQKAITKRNYDQAVSLLKGIINEDENYKDASRLLAEAIEFRRTTRKWWQNKFLWGGVGGAALLILGWFLLGGGPPMMSALFAPRTATQTSTVAPLMPAETATLTSTPAPTATAIPLSWARLNSGQFLPRATISAIVFDPTDPGIVYVGTEGAGIYKSIDGGLSWQPAQNGLSRADIGSLIIDPEEPKTLYAGLILGGVYKTTDSGQTWQAINQGIEIPGGAFLADVVLDPADRDHLYFTDSLALYETKNKGESWTKVQMPSCPKLITSMAIPPGASSTIYIADRERSDECDLGIYRSSDGGKTWDIIPMDLDNSLQLRYGSMAVASEPREIIYTSGSIEGGEKLYRTMDEGQTWEAILDHRCYAIHIAFGGSGKLYCGGPDQLFSSSDAGITWQTILKGNLIREVSGSPHSAEILFAGGEGSGLLVTADAGNTWSERNSGLGGAFASLIFNPLEKTTLYSAGGNSLYRSTNLGQTWELLMGRGSGLAFDKDGRTMYTLAETIMVSKDNGESWQAAAATHQRISSFVAHPQQPNMLIAVHESGFSLSEDSGETWDQRSNVVWADETRKIFGLILTQVFPDQTGDLFYILINGETTGNLLRLNGNTGAWDACSLPKNLTKINLLAIDPRDSHRIIISSPGNGLLISADGCQSWTLNNNGLGSLFVNSIAIDSNKPDSIYAGTDGGAYLSSDGGQTWGQINDGLLGATVVYSIVVDKESNVYAATPYGIFKLENR
ncbi:MAG: hypothetical protein HND47_11340 [Chloroflexi bacterium]|nr:hypothetical protein [Chloroflexota bacterium]